MTFFGLKRCFGPCLWLKQTLFLKQIDLTWVFEPKVGSLMKVKKTKNSNLWFTSSELNQILAIQLFCKFCPVNFFLIPFRAIWNFSYLLKPTLNGFFSQGGRSRISLNLDSHTLLVLYLCLLSIFGIPLQKSQLNF